MIQAATGKVVVVMGVIGSGKSTLSEELAAALDAKFFTEPDDVGSTNPYLSDFYAEGEAFRRGDVPYNKVAGVMQLHLLGYRFRQFQEAQTRSLGGLISVIDAGFYQDTCFARILTLEGQMPTREFETYAMIYRAMTTFIATPAVVIRVSITPETAQQRIARRYEQREGRKCEKVIPLEYLVALDTEIARVCDYLQTRGSHVITMAWEDDRGTPADRARAIQGLSRQIKNLKSPDPFMDFHGRLV